jgi:gliding motility associated protien GldN
MKKLFVLTALCSAFFSSFSQPLNDIAFRNVVAEKRVLAYDIPNERDIFWQKTIWRVLDVREKMNQSFMYPQAPFFDLLIKAVASGELTAYSGESDNFTQVLTPAELDRILFRTDTIDVMENEYEIKTTVVSTPVYYEDVKRFRIKEVWYVDSRSSTMKVRLLGIAPLQEVTGEDGSFRYEKPLFWIHYPSAREALAKETVFTTGNEAARMTWEDLFEMRLFSSYISKEGNVRNNRLQDLYSGVDLLLESDKIKQEVFNFEHDLWEY